MRILLATDHYPPFIGGAHRQAQLLAHGMAERGHEVAVATPWHPGTQRLEQEGDVAVHRVREMRTAIPALVRGDDQRHQPPFPDPATIWSMRRLIGEFEPDLIHAYGWLAFSVAAAMPRKGIPMLLSARDYGYFCANRTLLQKGRSCSGPSPAKCVSCSNDYYGAPKGLIATAGVYLSRPILARRTTGLHSISSFVSEVTAKHLFGRRGPPSELVRVTIPSFQALQPGPRSNGAAGDGLEPFLERLPEEPFILYVGAFRRVKGLEELFSAYGRLESAPPLVLIGTYERDSPGNFPPGVAVIEDAPHAAVMAAWDRALFGVMPSLWPEPFGSTVAEAMFRGRAVIGTQPGGHVDMIGDNTDLLVPAGDVDALVVAMQRLIDEPELREAYGKDATTRAATFTASANLPRFEQAYEDVIAAGAR